MLLSVTGASGAGKSTALMRLRESDLGMPVTCVEFDSIGVPDDADTAWRHSAIEQWVRTAIDAQERGEHMMLFGQAPPGELLAAPSMTQMHGVAVLALAASPEAQRERLLSRGEPADSLVHHLRFGEWFRRHCEDPSYAPEVIRIDTGVPMEWSRWEGVTAADVASGDPRWPVTVVDTDQLTRVEVADVVEAWARDVVDGAESPGS